MCGRCAAFGGTDLKDQEEGGIRADDRSTLLAKCRVTKSENFPDSKISVAKTFRIKRVNRANFQIIRTHFLD